MEQEKIKQWVEGGSIEIKEMTAEVLEKALGGPHPLASELFRGEFDIPVSIVEAGDEGSLNDQTPSQR